MLEVDPQPLNFPPAGVQVARRIAVVEQNKARVIFGLSTGGADLDAREIIIIERNLVHDGQLDVATPKVCSHGGERGQLLYRHASYVERFNCNTRNSLLVWRCSRH